MNRISLSMFKINNYKTNNLNRKIRNNNVIEAIHSITGDDCQISIKNKMYNTILKLVIIMVPKYTRY